MSVLYDYPEYYETAFSFRDIESEAGFLQECIKRYSEIPVRRVFEVACAHAPHAQALTDSGYQYIGLDINRSMLDYAARKWRHLMPSPEFIEADMTSFTMQKPVDFAYVMLGSLYLSGVEEMRSHFRCMTECLKPGGLYFLDWCVQFNDPLIGKAANRFSREQDGIRIDSRFNIRLIDIAQQMYEEIWTVDVNDHGRKRKFEMIERNHAIFPQEFLLFVENLTDFEFVGWWHDWDFNKPIDGASEVARPVVLLRRR
jgi:SAM-dependent methyltransferase